MSTETLAMDETTAIALLRWWQAAGVDMVWQDAPRDRIAETRAEINRRSRRRAARQDGGTLPAAPVSPATGTPLRKSGPPARSASRPAAPTPEPVDFGFAGEPLAMPDDTAVADARERARSAESLDALREALESFDGCNLRKTATTTVFGSGPDHADLMLIGEAPGREEDRTGEPFVGRSGQLLDRMLRAIGLDREAVRVTNAVPWRPPGNRAPSPAETAVCLPFIQRQIELVRPKALVCLGGPSAKSILGAKEGIMRIRGKWTVYHFGVDADETIAALPMLHPAYLLRQPAQKRIAWRDLLSLKERLGQNSPDA